MTYRIAVVTAGLREPSSTRLLADRLSDAVTASLGARGEIAEVDLVELRPLARPLADNLVTGFPPPVLDDAIQTVTRADALVAVTPVFTASYSGLFKTFFDVLDKEALAGKPTLIAATAGTARHSLVLDHALRPLFGYLRAVVVPTGVFAATEDFGAAADGGVPDDRLDSRIERAAGELADLLTRRTAARDRTAPGSTNGGTFDDVIPFEELLRRN
jgi:FMN reductase